MIAEFLARMVISIFLEEKTMHGYAERILHVDLSTGYTRIEPLREELTKKYIGGIGELKKRFGCIIEFSLDATVDTFQIFS